MWIFTLFDLPTETKKNRYDYNRFRKSLLKDGFEMLQFSVYIRHCASQESMEAHINHVEASLPKEGKVTILNITDKQFENIKHFWGVEQVEPPGTPQQLEMF
jgi:CRISPR-associated protein Cas2